MLVLRRYKSERKLTLAENLFFFKSECYWLLYNVILNPLNFKIIHEYIIFRSSVFDYIEYFSCKFLISKICKLSV